MIIPTLETERLVLRPFHLDDAKRVQELAGAREIYDTTAAIPHPYLDGMAEAWIGMHSEWAEKDTSIVLAMTLKTGELVGCIDFLGISKTHKKAEAGYWVGVPYWGKGYCTEALKVLIDYGFDTLGLNKIIARHLSRNPASGKVMLKAGMKKEGLLRKDMFRQGLFEDMELYGILNSDRD